MTEGNLVKWHKKEGDSVEIGDILAEIETDKATMEVESVEEGIIGKIFVPEGTDEVAVNTLIAVLLEEGEDASALVGMGSKSVESSVATPKAAPQKAEPKPEPSPASAPKLEVVAPAPQPASGKTFASPLAKRIAAQNNLDVSTLSGSGPRGRVVKTDVEAALASGGVPAPKTQSQKAPQRIPQGEIIGADDLFPAYEKVKVNNMRKVIAKRLSQSKQTVPHFYLTVDCQIDALLAARKDLNEDLEKAERISVNDFVIKAIACAMRDVPEANASWSDDHVKIYQSVDVSVAVAIEGGLITPVIKEADRKPLSLISTEIKDLAKRARDGKLRPEEFQGGTVSVSNLGMFGIKEFSAVINPPQGCILAVGAGEKRAVVNDSGLVEAATVMSCTLSVDHRVVDGAIGATFLKAFKSYIQKPVKMLV
tara:strand:- start:710 stop:1978 length:1269 start_codon:yes stop_codon:yes gene_type:complete